MENNKRRRRILSTNFLLKALSFIIVLFFMITNYSSIITYADDASITIVKSVDNTNPYVGESFVYTLRYANPSTTTNAENVVLTDVLPSNIEYVTHISSDDVQSVDVTNNGTNDVVTFNFKSPLPAGRTGFVKIIARFPAGKTTELINGNPNTAVNSATIKPSNGSLVTSNEVTVTPKVNSTSDWSISKVKYIPSGVLPALDQNVTYQITVNSNSSVGGLDLKNIVVTDTIPSGATFVSATNGGVFADGNVTWNIASLPVGASQSFYVVLKYETPAFTTASTVTNNVTATAVQYDDSIAPEVSAEITHGFTTPVYSVGDFTKTARQSDDRYSTGQTARFYLGGISNTGNVPLDKIEITDTIPSDITLTQISTGAYSAGTEVSVQYKTNLDTNWRDWSGSPYSSPSNTSLNVSGLSLLGGEYVTNVKWVITGAGTEQLNPGFSNTSSINVFGTVTATTGTTITNTASLEAYSGATLIDTKNASKTISVIDEMPWLVPQKTTLNNVRNYNYNDTVEFTLRIKNHDFATGDYVNPVFVDLIPQEFEDVTYTGWDSGNSTILTEPTINAITTRDIDSKTYTVFSGDVTGTLQPGEYIDIKYTAKIKDKTDSGYLTNSLYISTLDNSTPYENPIGEIITDANDLDGDTATDDRFVKADARIFVNFSGSLSSTLEIKGQYDADFGVHTYPATTSTLAGGIVDYRLTISNTGSNGPISNLIIIDKLPQINDTGVIDKSQRDTKWNPYLVNLITGENGGALPAGTKIYYSTVEDPSCVELDNPGNYTTNAADKWSETPPYDITTVKSIKIEFVGLTLNTNDEVVIEWPMRAPLGAPTNLVAWDSFGYSATYPDSDLNGENVIQSPFLPSEPLKVGFSIQTDELVNVGNFVWEDTDKDGIQDAGENGINGVLVNLRNASDNSIMSYTRTGFDQNGNAGYYKFPKVPAGTYKVEFVYPKTYTDDNGYESDYYLSPYLSGSDTAIDSNGNPATLTTNYNDMGTEKNSVYTPEFTLTTGEDMTIDLGLYRLGKIGDRVWYDKDADGVQDSGEAGISGVNVYLLDENDIQLDTTITDANGDYIFTNRVPGEYKVKFDIPTGYKLSPNESGSNTAIDSNPTDNGDTTATTPVFFLESGEVNLSVDMGVYLGHIGNLVWHDINADGIKDAGESVISGLTVKLYKDGATTPLKTTTTNSSGIYSFNDLFPGDYVVEVLKGTYNKFSPFTATDKATDNINDVDNATGKTTSFTISAGERIDTIDAGLYKFGSIGDKVWNDYDADGVQDSGEPGISGVTVSLTDENGDPVTDGNGNPVNSTTTNSSGIYSFSNLEPGTYQVVFTNPDGKYKLSPYNVGSITADSNGLWSTATDATVKTGNITITSGLNITTVDQGMYLGAIGDKVWNDYDADGIQDAGEPGISGVTVRLIDESTMLRAKDINGNDIADTTTNTNGNYNFNNLGVGKYIVEFTKPAGYDKSSPSFVGSNTSIDSNADTTTYRSDVIDLSSQVAQRDYTIDAGFYKLASIGDLVWEDINANGIQDTGENGIDGATVRLLNSSDIVISSTTTAGGGLYSFTGLEPGDYKIKVEMPAGYTNLSPKSQGADTAKDSNLNSVTLTSDAVNLISGENDITIDAGFYKLASIGDLVWEDINANGIQDAGENGISGATVKLLDNLGNELASTTTGSNGLYSFTGLNPGDYKIQITMPTGYTNLSPKSQGTDSTVDSNLNSVTFTSDTVNLISGENDSTIDAGFYKTSSIGDLVWEDNNANGIQDAGESGISGATVKLLDNLGNELASTTTDSNGLYLFTGLEPGDYKIKVEIPAGFASLSPKSQGSDTAKDSNLDAITFTSDTVTLISGESNISIDAGFYRLSALGNYVWLDDNSNGIQDENSSRGINGITVKLYDMDGNLLAQTVTQNDINGNSGYYKFDNLSPGSYRVGFSDLPAGYSATGINTVSDFTKDSDAASSTLKTNTITLISGQDDDSWDLGIKFDAKQEKTVGKTNSAQSTALLDTIGGTQQFVYNINFDVPQSCINVKITDSLNSVLEVVSGTESIEVYLNSTNVSDLFNIEYIQQTGVITITAKDAATLSAGRYKVAINCKVKDNAKVCQLPDFKIPNNSSVTINTTSYETNTVFVKPIYSSIGKLVWIDKNRNGLFDEDTEIGINGVTVKLFTKDGVLVGTQISRDDENGNPGYYMFKCVNPGEYYLEFSNLPEEFVVTQKGGGDNDKDSDVDPNTMRTDIITIDEGEDLPLWDLGIFNVNEPVENPKTAARISEYLIQFMGVFIAFGLCSLLIRLFMRSRKKRQRS